MLRFHRLAFAAGLLATGCANRSKEPSVADARPPEAADPGGTARTEAEARAQDRPSIALSGRLHESPMTEVVPDVHGRAALTLDADGGVRLWPDLHAEAVAAPIALPVQEPAWMSVARTKAGFVAAFVDTAGGARIGRIEIDADAGRWTPLFEIPATEPLFELHVLDGGTRILALTVDHRVLLWDTAGTVRAEIDRPGFVPWQLRVAEPAEGPPQVIAVLAGPTRVQRIEMKGDRLAIAGEALPVALDRGPNRNDLSLTPDGKTVLALMRRTAKSPRFELEAIDLHSGKRRIVAADSDAKLRPRVHATDATHVLLESGSGKGLRLDLAVATAWPPADGTPDRDALPLTALEPTDLPGSTQASRMHAVIAGGHRLVPTAEGLVVGARILGRAPFSASAVALDGAGWRVAWSTKDAIVVETLAGEPVPHGLPAPEGGAELLAFVGDEHMVVMDDKGRASLRRLADGQEVAVQSIPRSWGIATTGFRREGDAGGDIVLSSVDPHEPVHVLPVSEAGFGEVQDVPRAQATQWPEAGKPRRMASRDFTAAAFDLSFEALRLRPVEVRLAEPAPTGERVAFAQKTASAESFFDRDLEEWRSGPDDFVVTIVDRATRTRTFSVTARGLEDLAWSADGTRLAIASADGGLVLDATTGETLWERRDAGLTVR